MLLAGRNIPILVGIFTMTATWVGGGYINGTAEAVFDKARGLVWAQAPWGYALSLVIGGTFFAGVMRKNGFTTMLDPFEKRYGKEVSSLLFIPALIGEVFWSAAILVALGTTFGVILDYDFEKSILISASIAVGYTVLGGLLSVAYTDVIQLICIFIGLVIALPSIVDYAGGWDVLWIKYQQEFTSNAFILPDFTNPKWGTQIWTWLDFALLLMLGGIPWQVYFQRVLSSPDAKTARNLSYIAAVGCIVMAIPAILIGMVGATADWQAAGTKAPANASLVLPYVLQHLTPPVIATIGLSAVAAAVMSSVDSSILSASSMFVWNVYRPLFRPNAGEEEVKKVIRVAILVIGGIATVLALQVKSVYGLWYLCADLVYVILFPQLTMALFDKKANVIGAMSGACLGLFLRIGGGEPLLGMPMFLPYPMAHDGTSDFPFRTFAMLLSIFTIYLVSRVTQNISKAQPLQEVEE